MTRSVVKPEFQPLVETTSVNIRQVKRTPLTQEASSVSDVVYSSSSSDSDMFEVVSTSIWCGDAPAIRKETMRSKQWCIAIPHHTGYILQLVHHIFLIKIDRPYKKKIPTHNQNLICVKDYMVQDKLPKL